MGLSAVEMMQAVQRTWMEGYGAGGKGKKGRGRRGVYTSEDEEEEDDEMQVVGGASGSVLTGWRQLFDIAVRWQQLALPHEALLWVDEMT